MSNEENLDIVDRFKVEHAESWRKIVDSIPSINFPSDWKVTIIPPWGGAIVRFTVLLPDNRHKSIFLDYYSRLGPSREPYWEVYPYMGDIARLDIDDVEGLLKAIKEVN